MNDAPIILLAGFLGALARVATLESFRLGKAVDADIIRGLGQGSRTLGIAASILAGCLFAFAYAGLVSLAPIRFPRHVVAVSIACGIFHGMIGGLLLAIVARDPRNSRAGAVALYVLGQVVFGAVVGLVLAQSGARLRLLDVL